MIVLDTEVMSEALKPSPEEPVLWLLALGIAVSAGAFAPIGNGAFKRTDGIRSRIQQSQNSVSEGDGVLVHGNTGIVNSSIPQPESNMGRRITIRIRGGFHVVNEVFSSDPHGESSGIAFQAGFRQFISAYIQVEPPLDRVSSGDKFRLFSASATFACILQFCFGLQDRFFRHR